MLLICLCASNEREGERETLTIYCWLLNFYYVARKKKNQQLELHFGGREGEYGGFVWEICHQRVEVQEMS